MNRQSNSSSGKKPEQLLLEVFQSLDENNQSMLMDYAAKLLEEQEAKADTAEKLNDFNRRARLAAMGHSNVSFK